MFIIQKFHKIYLLKCKKKKKKKKKKKTFTKKIGICIFKYVLILNFAEILQMVYFIFS